MHPAREEERAALGCQRHDAPGGCGAGWASYATCTGRRAPVAAYFTPGNQVFARHGYPKAVSLGPYFLRFSACDLRLPGQPRSRHGPLPRLCRAI